MPEIKTEFCSRLLSKFEYSVSATRLMATGASFGSIPAASKDQRSRAGSCPAVAAGH